jgi:hypothetical protein
MQFVFFEIGVALGNIIYFSFPNHILKSLNDRWSSVPFVNFEAMLPNEELRYFHSVLEIKQGNMWRPLKDIKGMLNFSRSVLRKEIF